MLIDPSQTRLHRQKRRALSTKIGEILTETGKLERVELDRALRLQQETDDRLAGLLVQLGYVSERDVASALRRSMHAGASWN